MAAAETIASASSQAASAAASISAALSISTTSAYGTPGPSWIRVTSAPRMWQARATSRPVRPDARLVSTRIGSIASLVAPPVTTMWRPARSCVVVARAVAVTMASSVAILAFPSSILGSTNSTPHDSTRSMASRTPGWSYIGSCIAGAMTTGTSAPRAVVAVVVTGVSSTAPAILPTVLAVAGAIRSTSAQPSRPQRSTCSTRPVISVTTSCSVANSSAHGWMTPVALSLINARTDAPCRRSSWASSTVFTAAILPVTPSATLTPSSIRSI